MADLYDHIHGEIYKAWMAYYGVNTVEEAIAAKKDDPTGIKRDAAKIWAVQDTRDKDARRSWRDLLNAVTVPPPAPVAPPPPKPPRIKLDHGTCKKCAKYTAWDHPWDLCEECMTDDQKIQVGLKKGVIIDDLASPEVKNERGVNKAAYQRILDKQRRDRAQE